MEFRFCPLCASALAWQTLAEDGGDKSRLRCTACALASGATPDGVVGYMVVLTDHACSNKSSAASHAGQSGAVPLATPAMSVLR